MACETVKIGGVTAIICGRTKPRKRCGCGKPARYLCDWKMGGGKMCDRPICDDHAQQVAPDKHLCSLHQEAYRQWLRRREGRS